MMLSTKWLFYLAVAFVALLAGIVLQRVLNPGPPSVPLTANVLPIPRALPALTLRDQDGRSFTNANLKGHWSFLFLGYTHCPDVCPTTLNDLNRTVRLLQEQHADAPRVYFVSVDPKRDTPATLKRYVRFYNADFVGVTGDLSQLHALASALSSTFFYEPENRRGNYTVGHPAAVFLIDPAGNLAAIYMPPLLPSTMAADYRAMVGQRGEK